MHPHRSAYDPYAAGQAAAAEHRATDARGALLGSSSEARQARMQASGLPHGHMDASTGPSSSHDARPPPRLPRSHDYAAVPTAVRTYSDRPQPERHYDDYHQQRSRAPYSEQQQRSPRYAAAPLHAPPYESSSDARHGQPQPQQQQNYHDRAYARQPDATNYHHHEPPPHPHHSAYRDYRRDGMPAQAPMRPSLPSPRSMHMSAQRISPSSEYAHRAAYLNEPPHRSAYAPMSSAHAGRHVSDPRHDSADPSHASSSTTAGSTLATRKRKKQFKYMLERDRADTSKHDAPGANEQQHDAEHHDDAKAVTGADGASHRKESRKKVKKACVFCKRSHMPCEEARPCKRCVKRGISHLCRDAEPVGSAGAASASSNAPTKGGKFGEARNQARAMRRKHDANEHAPPHVAETETESDPESLASSAASSLLHHRPSTGSEAGSLPARHRRNYEMNVINVMPGAAAPDPDIRPAMPVSMLLSTETVQLARRPAERRSWLGVSEKEREEAWNRCMDAGMQHKMKQMLEAGPAAGDLNDIFGEMPISLLMTPAMANLPDGQSILRAASTEPAEPAMRGSPDRDDKALERCASVSLSTDECQVDEAGFKLPSRPKHLLQEEMATTSDLRGAPPTYSYTYGYAKLARWMHTRYTRESCEAVDRSLCVIRPKLMALSRSLPEHELIAVEDGFYALLEHYRTHVLETIPVPMLVTRRTGEIYAANSHACALFQLPARLFERGQICHYQLVAERDAVGMWAKYAREASGELGVPPTQRVTLEVDRSLLLFDRPGFNPRTGELLGDGVCEDGSAVKLTRKVVITFDAKVSKHGLPFMVTGVIVPLPDDEEPK
ncbi:related to RDS2-Regulator of drug sensitivity [Sporisorium reilianum SRZ2]|uniref:Related to RDS2-Regulator of drug sensitivity n=1 Tax=Sporisorium reilianum (strain SRZ2) TaxID=999809 RepID=E6ZQA9_SPORE|nr:related to RDS2-Regulator of drug sensitivity [Sporisorium reilianum SRZ2]